MAEGDVGKDGDKVFKWTAIVLTCPDKAIAQVIQNELSLRWRDEDGEEGPVVLCVEDPRSRVGSGGATINALLVVTEHISALQGYTVINSDVLQNAHILIVHVGRDFVFDPCTKAFVSVGMSEKGEDFPACNLDLLIDTVTHQVACKSPPGVWVCSTDMFLDLHDAPTISFEGVDAVAVSVLARKAYAANHGVFKLNSQNLVEDIIFRGSEHMLSRCCIGEGAETEAGQVALVAGVVYMGDRLSQRLLSLHVTPPLDACTYIGLDSGARPIQLSLFFDVLMALCDGVTESEYVSGERGVSYARHLMPVGEGGEGDAQGEGVRRRGARQLLWRELHDLKLRVWPVPEGCHSYMDESPSTHHKHLSRLPMRDTQRFKHDSRAGAFIAPGATVAESAVVLNSLVADGGSVGEKTVLSHTLVSGEVTVGKDSVLNGVHTEGLKAGSVLGDSLVLQTFRIRLPALKTPTPILTVFGKFDDLKASMSERGSTMCNNPWVVFFGLTGITAEDLWDPSVSDYDRCIWNAKLYPALHLHGEVGWPQIMLLQGGIEGHGEKEAALKRWREAWRLSLEDIMKAVDVAEEFEWRRRVGFEHVGCAVVRDTLLLGQDRGLASLYHRAARTGADTADTILKTLDDVAATCGSPGIAARCLANIANVLGAMAGGKGGLRSGPAANTEWAHAFQLLEEERVCEGVRALAEVRTAWRTRGPQTFIRRTRGPEMLVRAARHYEGAAQILIRRAVLTARQFVRTRLETEALTPGLGKWVTVTCPARIDIAGGWSDTPPITYEHGGAVLGAAVTVDGQKPIGAKVKRIPESILRLCMGDDVIVVDELAQLADYNQPHSPGALLKAGFVCAEIIQYPSALTLSQQLLTRYGGGFELHTWSNLPHGSGLGTSSILAGAVMAALWKASGRYFDIHSLIHAVLQLEQMLTTGGGWQDQVHGLTPGLKLGVSGTGLPLHVHLRHPTVSPQTLVDFSQRLVLVYTGVTRLARNLLQNVLRTWYARDPEIVATEDELVETAHKCADAFTEGDLSAVGSCMERYWSLKKAMAPGCEPAAVVRLRDALSAHVYGSCMAGAGGGGFLYVLCKRPHSAKLVQTLAKATEGCEDVTVHEAAIDDKGMELSVEGQEGLIQIPLYDPELHEEA